MSTALLVLAVVAGLACPAHMWWRGRRGERAACHPAARARPESPDSIRERQRELAARIDELSQVDPAERGGHRSPRLG